MTVFFYAKTGGNQVYGDRKKVKNNEIKTKGDQYLVEAIKAFVDSSGEQEYVLIRKWIEEGLKRDIEHAKNLKNNKYLVDL